MTDLLANDPVSGYENIYKEAFADEAEAFFENAVRTWGIDPELNARQARELDQLIAEKKKLDSRKGSWITLLVLLLLVFAVWGIVIWANNENPALCLYHRSWDFHRRCGRAEDQAPFRHFKLA